MTQWRVLCPNHVLQTATTTGDIRELSSYPDMHAKMRVVRSIQNPFSLSTDEYDNSWALCICIRRANKRWNAALICSHAFDARGGEV